MEIEGVEYNVLRAFHHELRVDALAWSPESRLDQIPIIRCGQKVVSSLSCFLRSVFFAKIPRLF